MSNTDIVGTLQKAHDLAVMIVTELQDEHQNWQWIFDHAINSQQRTNTKLLFKKQYDEMIAGCREYDAVIVEMLSIKAEAQWTDELKERYVGTAKALERMGTAHGTLVDQFHNPASGLQAVFRMIDANKLLADSEESAVQVARLDTNNSEADALICATALPFLARSQSLSDEVKIALTNSIISLNCDAHGKIVDDTYEHPNYINTQYEAFVERGINPLDECLQQAGWLDKECINGDMMNDALGKTLENLSEQRNQRSNKFRK